MLIECTYCESRVDATELARHDSFDQQNDPSPFRAFLLECPGCKNPLLAGYYPHIEDRPSRLWPSPDRYISSDIPSIVSTSLEEAERCLKAKAYTACAVMCGRSLEGICRHLKTKAASLAGGLKELVEKKIIDGRLFEWSEALRKQRNIAAHASGEKITGDDAQDLFDFSYAICEYVFVLNAKYEAFVKRQTKSAAKQSAQK
jgi:hypothetical protein